MFQLISDPERPLQFALLQLEDNSQVIVWVRGNEWGINHDSERRWLSLYHEESWRYAYSIWSTVETIKEIDANGGYRDWGLADPMYSALKEFLLAIGAMQDIPAR